MPSFEVEPYKPESPQGQALANPEFTDLVELHCVDPEDMRRTILEIEASLGLRLGTDLHNGYPRRGFTSDTWRYINGLYIKSCQTRFRELYAAIDLQPEAPRATYTVPLAGFGQTKKAVEGTFNYEAVDVKRGATVFRMLGRTGTTKLVPNRYYVPKEKSAKPGVGITDISTFQRYEQGTLGTAP